MKKSRIYSLILAGMLIAGAALLLYPSMSDYWNRLHASKAISHYSQNVAEMDEAEYQMLLQEAQAFNILLAERKNPYTISDNLMEVYKNLLNLDDSGLIGYIEIPAINCRAAIYRTAEERVLQKGIGHLPWTSFPVGGESTHTVLSGHRGLPSAKLFSNLDKVEKGDYFYIHVLDEVLQYQIDQILVVEPKETEALLVIPEKDYCTLVTCTPYGINTHRMLVRGERVGEKE